MADDIAHTTSRAAALEAEGDALRTAGHIDAAIEKYREALELDDTRAALYDKLITTHQAIARDWTAEDFAMTLDWEMRKQALENPEVRTTHERLSPEWNEVMERLRRMMVTTDAHVVTQLCEEIAAFEAKAVRPLLDFLILLKASELRNPVETEEQQ